MQSERFNQRSPRERGAPRKSAGCIVVLVGVIVIVVEVVVVVVVILVVLAAATAAGVTWGEPGDYSDNQRALNLGPKRAETPSALCRRVVLRR